MAIHDTMQYIKCDVSTICMGMAASMGAFLLASGTKGKRFALPNAEIMIHQPLIGGQGGGLSGQTTDIKIHAEHMVYIRDKMNRPAAGKDPAGHRARQLPYRAAGKGIRPDR